MKRLVPSLLLSVLSCGLGVAGTKSTESWENLKQLRAGDKIEVIDQNLRSFRGRLVSVSDEAIALQSKKDTVTVERANVFRVSVRDTSHRTRNMLLGSGILGGIALAAAVPLALINSNEGNGCGPCVAAIAAGFGGGAALGSLPGWRTVYRAENTKVRAG